METEIKRISLIGIGKLGAPLAACFAWKGFPTLAVDCDSRKIKTLNQGRAPLYEPRLQEIIQAGQGRLRATLDHEKAVLESDVTFIVVPTPSEDNGNFSLKYVLESVEKIGKVLRNKKGHHLVVLTSTVMPGATAGRVKPALEKHSGKVCGKDFGLCYSPEFVALGTVIRDFLNPDFVLIGESDSNSGKALEDLYKRVCENSPPAARMDFVNAELAKLAVNTFVTTKISFANMLARMCEKLPGANVDTVASAVGLDTRIGKKYLKGSISYGGPCFPRDNRALGALAHSLGAFSNLAEATDAFNRMQIQWLANLVKNRLPQKGSVGILGLSYKPNSDVAEEAQGILLTQALSREKIPTAVYDPAALGSARLILNNSAVFSSSAQECIRKSDVVVITTPWEEFKNLKANEFGRPKSPRIVIDCWRILDHLKQADGIVYVPLGVGGDKKC